MDDSEKKEVTAALDTLGLDAPPAATSDAALVGLTAEPFAPGAESDPFAAPPAQENAPSPTEEAFQTAREFAEKATIGHPPIEANPAFSIFARACFDEKKIEAIRSVLEADAYGVRFEDVAIQLSAGKLLVPRISEFAAIQLAQKLFDIVDNLEIALAGELLPSPAEEGGEELIDPANYKKHIDEAHDLEEEPGSEADVFTSTVSELAGYRITRVLSAITLSAIVPAEAAEDQSGGAFEAYTESLTHQLASRAFKLGAHGVIGIGFTIKLIDGYRDKTGEPARAYRLLGTGTAVRAKKNGEPETFPFPGGTDLSGK